MAVASTARYPESDDVGRDESVGGITIVDLDPRYPEPPAINSRRQTLPGSRLYRRLRRGSAIDGRRAANRRQLVRIGSSSFGRNASGLIKPPPLSELLSERGAGAAVRQNPELRFGLQALPYYIQSRRSTDVAGNTEFPLLGVEYPGWRGRSCRDGITKSRRQDGQRSP